MKATSLAAMVVVALLARACDGQGLRTLVILEQMSTRQTHSTFFAALKDRGHHLEFRLPSDSKLALQTYGEYNYDNLIIFGASSIDKFGGSLTIESILAYLDRGHHLLLAVDGKVSPKIRQLANECGIDFDAKETRIVDHQNHDVSDGHGDHSLVVTEGWRAVPVLTGDPQAPLLFKGIGQALDASSKLVFPILTGSPTTVSAKAKGKMVSMGKDTVLVSALQGRNNARATFVGSLEMCSDRLYSSPVQASSLGAKRYPKSGNEAFCTALAAWTFKETGLLKAENVVHHLASNNSLLNPAVYTITDDVKYSVDISEWDWQSQSWKPFTKDDVQLELVRMDPFQRRTLQTDHQGHYWTGFQLPDIFGIYHFTINYKRRGYSNLITMDQISVRPFKHNEHPRFLVTAYPYYVSAFSMLVGFFVFGLFFLYQKNPQASARNR